MTYVQKKLGQYDYFEVISALRKEIKLCRTEDAIYWLTVLLTYGESAAKKTAAKQLWIMAAEDCYDEQIVMRAFAVYQMASKVNETDHLYFLVARMCKSAKWWESPEGKEVDYLWAKAEGDIKKRPKKIPSFAIDRHTARGKLRLRRGEHIDERFSGTDYGRQQTVYLYDKYGNLSPDYELDEAFYTYWEQFRELLGHNINSNLFQVMEGHNASDKQ